MNLDGVPGAVAVDLDGANSTTARVGQIVEEMQQSIGRIGRASANGVAEWSGQASGAFDNSQGNWNASAVTLNQALNDIRQKLNTGFAGYEDGDAAAAGGVTV